MHKNSPLTKEDVAEAVFYFYHVIIPILAEPGKTVNTGVVLNIRDHSDTWILNARGGNATERQFQKLEMTAHEQNNALHRHREASSTWMLRNHRPNPPQPGAIRTPYDDRLAIVGFTWQQNQSASLWLAERLRRMSFQETHRVAYQSVDGRDYIRHRSLFRSLANKLEDKVT